MNVTTMGPIADRAADIPRAPLRCIGIYPARDGMVDYPIAWADAARDMAWARSRLAAAGIGRGDFVAIVSTGHEAPWYQALIDAAYALEATVCPLEPARYEIGRAEMFFRRFPISAIIGLDPDLGGALVEIFGADALLADKKLVLVRPEARALFPADCARIGFVLPVGPALALVQASDCGTLIVDEAEWRLDSTPDGLSISALQPRAHCPVALPLVAVRL